MHSHMIETEHSCNVLQTEVTAFVRFTPNTINSKVRLFVLDQILHSWCSQSVRLLQGGRPTGDLKYLFSFSYLQFNATMTTGFHKQKYHFPSFYHYQNCHFEKDMGPLQRNVQITNIHCFCQKLQFTKAVRLPITFFNCILKSVDIDVIS